MVVRIRLATIGHRVRCPVRAPTGSRVMILLTRCFVCLLSQQQEENPQQPRTTSRMGSSPSGSLLTSTTRGAVPTSRVGSAPSGSLLTSAIRGAAVPRPSLNHANAASNVCAPAPASARAAPQGSTGIDGSASRSPVGGNAATIGVPLEKVPLAPGPPRAPPVSGPGATRPAAGEAAAQWGARSSQAREVALQCAALWEQLQSATKQWHQTLETEQTATEERNETCKKAALRVS